MNPDRDRQKMWSGKLRDDGSHGGKSRHVEFRRQGGQAHAAVIAAVSRTDQTRQ
jgi:hypothetical protein